MPELLRGHGVSPGTAAGPVLRMPDPVTEPPAGPPPRDTDADVARIRPAMDLVATDLWARAGKAEGETKEVLEATAMMASDPELADLITHRLPLSDVLEAIEIVSKGEAIKVTVEP